MNRFPFIKIVEEAWRRWWFLLFILLAQCLPPYAVRGYALNEWGRVLPAISSE